jgi:hypothetical protein
MSPAKTKDNSMAKRKLIQTAAFGVPEYELQLTWSYRPRLSPEHSQRLWRLKVRSKKPITELVAEALDFYFEHVGEKGD